MVTNLDEKRERKLWQRSGDVIWDHVLGESLALAPMGGRVALVRNLQSHQMHTPPTLIEVGTLQIWDIERGSRYDVTAKAIEVSTRPSFRGLSWFPDGKRLAYVELLPEKQVVLPDEATGEADPDFYGWDKVPVVHILDTDTGEKTFFRPGWCPVVSSDGKTMLVHDFGEQWSLVNVDTRKSKRVHWPGAVYGGAIALLEGKRVIYWGLPTSGTGSAIQRAIVPWLAQRKC
jgi:hypothetical protein